MLFSYDYKTFQLKNVQKITYNLILSMNCRTLLRILYGYIRPTWPFLGFFSLPPAHLVELDLDFFVFFIKFVMQNLPCLALLPANHQKENILNNSLWKGTQTCCAPRCRNARTSNSFTKHALVFCIAMTNGSTAAVIFSILAIILTWQTINSPISQ